MCVSSVGHVFEVLDLPTNKRLAVKRIRKAQGKVGREYKVLTELQDCTQCTKLLNTFFSVNEEKKLTQNLVFELADESLETLIQRTREVKEEIGMERIKSIMRQILEGLKYMHSKSISHRDLKPDNVLLYENSSVRLCDFGSSKKIQESECNFPHIVSRYYRAPELSLCHTDYTTKIDIWAAGCILAELITLEPLFPGKTEGLQLLEIMAILGPPKKEDQEYLYRALKEETRKKLKSVKGLGKVGLSKVLANRYKRSETRQVISLLKGMLEWNPNKRITAEEALAHPFFS